MVKEEPDVKIENENDEPEVLPYNNDEVFDVVKVEESHGLWECNVCAKKFIIEALWRS